MKLKLSEQSSAQLREAEAKARSGVVASLKEKPAVFRLERPLDPARARSLGYKSLPGYMSAISRVPRGGRRKPRPTSGRRSKHAGSVLFTPGLSRGEIAVARAARKFKNMRALGYHKIAEDGTNLWFEVVFVDRAKD